MAGRDFALASLANSFWRSCARGDWTNLPQCRCQKLHRKTAETCLSKELLAGAATKANGATSAPKANTAGNRRSCTVLGLKLWLLGRGVEKNMKKGTEHVRSIEDFGKLSVRYNNVNVSETLEVIRCGSMVMQKLCCDNRSACLAQLLVGHKVDLARLITFHQQCYRCSNRHVAGVSNHNIIYHNISKGYCTWMLPETPLSTWLKSNPRHQLHKASRTSANC